MDRLSCNDAHFGPIVENCRDNFDFTLVFQDTILSLVPSAITSVCAALRILYLRKRPPLITAKKLQLLKLVSDWPFIKVTLAYEKLGCPRFLCRDPSCFNHDMGYQPRSTVMVRDLSCLDIIARHVHSMPVVVSRTRSQHATFIDVDHISSALHHVRRCPLPNPLGYSSTLTDNPTLHNVLGLQSSVSGSRVLREGPLPAIELARATARSHNQYFESLGVFLVEPSVTQRIIQRLAYGRSLRSQFSNAGGGVG